MKNFRFLIVSLSLLLLISFVPIVSAKNHMSEKVSVADAEHAAQKFISYSNNDT